MESVLTKEKIWQNWGICNELKTVFDECPNVILPDTRNELINLSVGGKDNLEDKVAYDVDVKEIIEADVIRCKNVIAINYPEAYMRRRDPDCMVVNNIAMTDKTTFTDRFNKDFEPLRNETLNWLKSNEIILVPFMAGGNEYGYPALMVAPKNAAFFAASIYDLQGVISNDKLDKDFTPYAIIYVAPPFRHTHFEGIKLLFITNKTTSTKYFHTTYTPDQVQKKVYTVSFLL